MPLNYWEMASFVSASCLMGLGIALDVAVATLVRFRDSTMSFRSWTFPITLTHIGLPAIGYYGWWMLGKEFVGLAAFLGIAAFVLITLFLYETVCGWIDVAPRVSLEPVTRRLLGRFDQASHGRWLAILAVSMDALWSGPAKAAQARSGSWSDAEVAVSFLLAGIVVALVAQTALIAANWLARRGTVDIEGLSRKLVLAKVSELVVLGGFGVLSLWNGFSFQFGLGDLARSILVSGVIALAFAAVFWRQLLRVQRAEMIEHNPWASDPPT